MASLAKKTKAKSTNLSTPRFSRPVLVIFALIFAAIGGYAIYRSFAAGSNIYIAQSQAGSGSGGDCADAKPATFFNASANWGTGSTQIGPGTIVHLCGTITSQLGVNGSGVAGNPITIFFETGAKLSEPFCSVTSGCLSIGGQSYITVDGNHTGIIESTANGMGLANQQAAMGIFLQNTSNIIIQNLTIQNLFIHTSCTIGIQANCDLLSSKSQYAIEDYDGNNNRITGNIFHDTQLGVYYRTDSGFGQNNRVDHNEFYNIDNPVNQTYSFGGGTTGPFFFNNNYSHDFGNWDAIDKSNPNLWGWAYHHDGLHCYTSANGTGAAVHTVGNYYYDNKFVVLAPQMGAGFTSFFFLEGGSGPGATPCDDSTSNNYLFNNDLIDNGAAPAEAPPAAHGNGVSNGVMCPCAGSINHIWNNTMIGASNNGGGPAIFQMATPSSEMKNNVITTGDQLIHASPGFASGSPDYNVYANGSQNGNTWVCGNSFLGSLSQWQSCIGSAGDAHSSYAASAQLNTDGTPQAGSPVLSAGANLTSLCTGNLVPLCQDYNGNARPASGAWDIGAFQYNPAAAGIYISQSGAGTADGSSCTNAHAVSWLNAVSNWGTGSSQIGPGDTVYLCGNFTDNLQVLGNGTSGNPITIQPAAGQTVNAQAILLGDGSSISAPSYITVNGNHSLTTTDVEVDYRGFAGDPVPSYDIIENLHITNMSSSGGGMMHVWDGSHITITGNEIGPGCCNADAVDIAIRSNGNPNNNNIVFTDNNVHDIYDTCTEVPTRFTGCSGIGFGDAGGSGQQHIDGMQIYGADNLDIERNIFNLQGDERQGIFMQPANGGSFSNITVVNNMLSNTTDNTFSMSGPGTNSFSGYAKILYNTIIGPAYIYNSVFQAGTPVTIVGNIFGGPTGNQSFGGCSMTYGDGSTLTPLWRNNVFTSQSGCDASDHGNALASFVQAAFPGVGNCTNTDGSGCKNATGDPNLDLSSGSQVAVDGGESAYCPSVDVHGSSRPQGTACDIGADESSYSGGGGTNNPPPGCVQSATTWQNNSITNQTGNFNFTYDTTPSANNMDGVTGLSSGSVSDYPGLATIVRFNSSGFIDAYNGTAYVSDASISYTANTSYHVVMSINVAAKTYSVKITPQGGSQITLATNYAFRASASSLSNWAVLAETGNHTVCNVSVTATSSIPGDTNNDNHVTLTDLTNLLANWNTNNAACDFNNDGTVNGVDLSVLLSHYGT